MKKLFLLITIYFLFWEKIYTQTATFQVAAPVDVYALGLDYATIKVDNPTTNMIYIQDFFSNMEILMPDGKWLGFNKIKYYTYIPSPRPIRKGKILSENMQIALTTLLKEDSIFGEQLLKKGGTINLRVGSFFIDNIKFYSNIFSVNVLPLNSEDLQVWDYFKVEGIDINIFTSTLSVRDHSHIKTYQNVMNKFPQSTFGMIADFILTSNGLVKPYLTKTEKAAIKQKINAFLDSPFPLVRQRAKETLNFHFREEE